MKPKVFIPYSEPGSDEISYLYFVQVKPEPHFKEYPFTPGHFLYDTSKNALLRSLAEEVLNDLDVPLPFTVPTAELVLGSMSGSVVPKTQYGAKLPQVVRERFRVARCWLQCFSRLTDIMSKGQSRTAVARSCPGRICVVTGPGCSYESC